MAYNAGLMRRTPVQGVVPYYPTPEEQAMAIPPGAAGGSGPMPAPTGMFGAQLKAALQPEQQSQISSILSRTLNQSSPQPMMGGGSIIGQALADQSAGNEGGAQSPFGGALTQSTSPAGRPPITIDRPDIMGPIDFPGTQPQLPDLSNATAKHPGFFQHGGLGGKILHGVGEFALRYSAGQGNPYAMMVLRNRFDQQQAQVRLMEQVKQRQTERDEWTWREQYKSAHPDDQFTQYLTAAGIDPASPQGRALYRQRAESLAAPPMMAVDGFDAQNNPTKTFIPRTAFGAGGQSGSPGLAAGTVRNGYRYNGGNPNDRNSWVPVGGASPAGGATFR